MSAKKRPDRNFSFRFAEHADIPVIRQMAETTWRKCYTDIISPAQMTYMLERMYGAEVIAEEIEDGVIWELALRDNKPVAFYSCAFDQGEQRLKLNKLYVLPEAQGEGCGREMLKRVRNLGAGLGARKVWLQVNKKNVTAIRAYERAGYHIEREDVFDIGSGFVMDDYIMAMAIPDSSAVSPKDAVPVET